MSVAYSAVGWNRQKLRYDAFMAGGVGLFLISFFGAGKAVGLLQASPDAQHDDAMLLIRGLGIAALALLHVILWIGPLARLDPRLLPLLYNRRHMGVTMCLLGLGHASVAIIQYHGFGNLNPLLSLLTSNTAYLSPGSFPFETLGLLALVILIFMAATSHDFWLANLSARVWKALHMGVYGAYVLLIGHVALGALQQERSPVLTLILLLGVAVTTALHIAAGARERAADAKAPAGAGEHLLDIGPALDIPLNRAKVVTLAGRERVAVFRYTERGQCKLSAVANVCAHQQGPLGEGKVESGCITCPWHGYQYRPGDGCAPPPFHEKVATYRLTLRGDRVLLDPRPLPPGTPVAPAICTTPGGSHG